MRTFKMKVRRNPRNHALLRNMMEFGCIKYAAFVTLVMVMCFNIFFGYKVNTNCDNKAELATLELYYKRLLDEKTVMKKARTDSPITKSYIRHVRKGYNKGDNKRTSVDHRNSRDKFNIITRTPEILQFNNRDRKEEIIDDGDKNSKIAFQSSNQEFESRKKFVINNMKDEKTWKDVIKINNKNNSLVKLKKFRGLKMDWWYDICMLRIIKEQTWHPLFPNSPQHETWISKTADEERVVGSHFRRIYGYLYTKKSGYYDFKLSSRDGADLVLLDTSKPPRLVDEASNGTGLPEVFYISLGKDIMDYQDKKINLSEMFNIEKRNIWLNADNLYFLELVQGGRYFIKYKIEWRESVKERVNSGNATGVPGYEVIDKRNLMYTSGMSSSQTPSRIAEKNKKQQRYPVRDSEAIRLAFYKTPVLQVNSKIHGSNFLCEKRLQENRNITYRYQGYQELTENFLVYPKEHFDFIRTNENYITLGKEQALDIAHKTFDKINSLYNGELQLEHIVHMVTNVNRQYKPFQDWKRNIHFVELDVQRQGGDSIFRTSQFVQLNPDAGLCFLEDYLPKDEKVVVNILTPIRNQVVWFKYLIQMLEEIVDATNETNYQLILIDNNSTDGDYKAILQNSRLKHVYVNLPISNFNKVKALNFGLQYVLDRNSIAYVMDLHLQMPLNMLDRIRKLTIQGKTAFSPTLLKLNCGEHEQYTDLLNSEWLDYGTGMIAMYKSDWSTIKGYNEKLFGNKWGGEDWEVIDRLFQNGLYLIHLRIPRFYHIHHSRNGKWYGNDKA